MFFFNFLFWLSGLVLIIIGAVVRNNYGDYFSFVSNKFANVSVLIIVVGVVVFIVGFLGCCGAVKENYCMVTTFAVLLAIIFILEIVAGALGIAYKSKVKEEASKALGKAEKAYGTANEVGSVHIMDMLQQKFKCCGANGTAGYKGKSGNLTCSFPATNGVKTCHEGKKCSGKLYKKGCEGAFIDFLKKNMVLIGGVAIGIAFIQLLGIIFACILMRAIKGEYEVV